nr:MAG TPA: hypothetical protein [Caudoviricetes sp.]DAY99608.1 MAG TPA: hypothetical protein [Caudoviricetes sp.]
MVLRYSTYLLLQSPSHGLLRLPAHLLFLLLEG